MPTFLAPKTFATGDYLTFTELNAAIGDNGALHWLKNALAQIGITAGTGAQTVDSAMAGCRVYGSGNTEVANAQWTAVSFSTVRFARWDSMDFNPLLPDYPTFVHLPTKPPSEARASATGQSFRGYWAIGAHVEFKPNATGQRGVRIKSYGNPIDLTGASVIASILTDSIGGSGEQALSLATQNSFDAAGGSYGVEVYQNSGDKLTLAATPNYTPELWFVRMGN